MPRGVSKPKIITVVGPTATGKSGLAVELAQEFNGEVISADSRQVYRGLDLGTGKVTEEEKQGVPHHLLDIADPRQQVSVDDWKKQAEQAIEGILLRGRLPILAGGTGFYIQAVVDNFTPPPVPPNHQRRAELEQLSLTELNNLLAELDPERLETLERENKRRVIRAIEIAEALGTVPKESELKAKTKYEVLQIGLTWPAEALKKKINERLEQRLRQGMLEETQKLHQEGLSLQRMEELGLEYRFLARQIKGELTPEEMQEQLKVAIWRYAKRQLTWFKRDHRIEWFTPYSKQLDDIKQRVREFLGRY